MKQFAKKRLLLPELLPPNQLSIAIAILKVSNCRASEILSAEWSNFRPERFLLLIGKKSSSNVIIHDRQILQAIERLPRLHETLIFPSLNYYHLYRHVKTHYSHLFRKFKKRKNFKVTHGFRYEAVHDFQDEKMIRDILHHRSIKSGKYYKQSKGDEKNAHN